MLRPMVLPPLRGRRGCGFHDAGTSAGGDDKAVALGRDLGGPFGQQVGEAARVFIVASHVDGGFGAFMSLAAVRRRPGRRCAHLG